MVAETRNTPSVQPIPASPARKIADPETAAWIHGWLQGFPACISGQADTLTPKLEALGFTSYDSLMWMTDIADLTSIGVPVIHAKMMIKDAKAHFPSPKSKSASPPRVTPTPTRKPFLNWSDRMVGTHICTKQELLRWLMALLFFIEAQSDTLGPILRAFCLDPGMPQIAYLALHAQIPSWEQRQLAATIISSIPPAMFILVSASLPNMIAADGLDILLAICKPHYGAIAIKAQIQAATDLCLHHIPVLTHMSQLQLALNNHLQGLALLKQHGEQFGDAMIRAGLMTLVRPLKLADEIKVATDCLEGAGGTFTSVTLIALIQKRASEGLMIPSTAKETAAAASAGFRAPYGHHTQCHSWMAKSICPRGEACSWAHDPAFKGRTDLVPNCPRQAAEGKCSINNCYYKHPTPSGSANLPATLPVTLPSKDRAAAAVQDTHAHEMAEIKTMLYEIIKVQAEQQRCNTEQLALITEQKAFITHMLAEDVADG